MAEEKKDFPWVQLIATIGTIVAALIGITPYILKLNSSPAPQTPTIVVLTLPPAAITPAPVTTPVPATTAETTPVANPTIAVTTMATSGPPAVTLPPGPAIHVAVNTSGVLQGGFILASGSTDTAVPLVTITLTNSTTFQSDTVPVTLTQGVFQFQVDTSHYAPGDYTITAAVPDTQAMATASFTITATETTEPTTEVTTIATTTAATTIPVNTTPTTAATTMPVNTTPTATATSA